MVKPTMTPLDSKGSRNAHCKVVLVRFRGECATFIYNETDGAYYLGHYFGDDLAAARIDFTKRQ